MSENDYKVVPEFGEHSGESKGVSDAPIPALVGSLEKPVAIRLADLVLASGQRFETVFEFLGEGIVFQNQQGRIVLANEAASEILGMSHDQLEGRTSVDPRWQALKEDGSPFPGEEHPAMVSLATGLKQSNVLMNVLKPDGTRVWIKINAVPVFDDESSKPTSVVTSFCDITSIKLVEEQLKAKLNKLQESQERVDARRRGLERANLDLRKAADIDSDTGLKNRRCFMERLCSEVALASRKQIPLSVLLGEVRVTISSTEKPESTIAGETLASLGKILKNSFRASDLVARYSHEKFGVILPHTSSGESSNFAERISVDLANAGIDVTIAVAEYRTGTLTNEYLEHAEEILFRAKVNGVGVSI